MINLALALGILGRATENVLLNLRADGKIKATPPASKRPKRKGIVTFGKSVKLTFPPREVPQNGNQIQN